MGISINSTWFLGSERRRQWQHGTEILHSEQERDLRKSSYASRDDDTSASAPPPLSLSIETEGLSRDCTPSAESPAAAAEGPPRVGFLPSPKSLRSPRAFLRTALRGSPKTPLTPRTPGGSLLGYLFDDV